MTVRELLKLASDKDVKINIYEKGVIASSYTDYFKEDLLNRKVTGKGIFMSDNCDIVAVIKVGEEVKNGSREEQK